MTQTQYQSSIRRLNRHDKTEGRVAKAIEERTAQLPSDVFLWAAGASIVGSLVFQMMGRKQDALFVGQWAPTFLVLGLYNKIVKVMGSDAEELTM